MIVLFTTEELSFREAADVLLESGMRGVMRFDAVQRVDSIPVLGTGKTDYKALRLQVEVMSEENTDSKPTESV